MWWGLEDLGKMRDEGQKQGGRHNPMFLLEVSFSVWEHRWEGEMFGFACFDYRHLTGTGDNPGDYIDPFIGEETGSRTATLN